MKNIMKYRIHQLYKLLRESMPIMIFIMLIFFGAAIVGFQKDNRQILEGIAKTGENTETIVAKQDETLEAIKDTAEDNKLLSEEKTNIIICMLQVPVGQRTTDTVANCRRQSEARQSPQASQAAPQSSNSQASSQPVASADEPSAPPEVPDNEGFVTPRILFIPSINIPSPF